MLLAQLFLNLAWSYLAGSTYDLLVTIVLVPVLLYPSKYCNVAKRERAMHSAFELRSMPGRLSREVGTGSFSTYSG